MTTLQKQLFELQDLKYRDFHAKLLPGIDKETIIGIRTPILRKFAKDFDKSANKNVFLQELPHVYYEENNLHMMLIAMIKDFNLCLDETTRFVPYINNWATCDLPIPKCFAKHKDELLSEIQEWIHATAPYTIRYGIGLLMRLYLDEDFKPEYLSRVTAIQSEEYYVNMMIAWYLATALAKQWDSTIPYLENHLLSDRVHKKTIQKAIESYRITEEQKRYLKKLR